MLGEQQQTRVTNQMTVPESDDVYRPTCILHQLGDTGYMVAHLAAICSWSHYTSYAQRAAAHTRHRPIDRGRAMMSAGLHNFALQLSSA